jgi:hypothetical protein
MDLPVNLSAVSDIESDLVRQVSLVHTNMRAVVNKCYNLTGEALAYLGKS